MSDMAERSVFPFLSVVIPVLNGERTLRACLKSVVAADYPPDRREILVVDNGSTDGTRAIIKEFPVRYLYEPQRGCPQARNLGIREAKGQIIVSTDADCVVSQKWLLEMVKGFERDEVGGVAGEVVAYLPRTPAERYAARVRHLSPQKYITRPILPFAAFANLAFRREVFDRVGFLDEDIPLGESTDFCTRFLRETGQRLQYAPKALVFHQHRKTVREFFWQQWKYGRGHAQLHIKYRKDVPWGRRQRFLAYIDVAKSLGLLFKSQWYFLFRRGKEEDVCFCYFECLKKIAERMGFVGESVRRGYFYF